MAKARRPTPPQALILARIWTGGSRCAVSDVYETPSVLALIRNGWLRGTGKVEPGEFRGNVEWHEITPLGLRALADHFAAVAAKAEEGA